MKISGELNTFLINLIDLVIVRLDGPGFFSLSLHYGRDEVPGTSRVGKVHTDQGF